MSDILQYDVPDLKRINSIFPEDIFEYERPTESSAAMSGYHSVRSVGLGSVWFSATNFLRLTNGCSLVPQKAGAGNAIQPALVFPKTTSQEPTAIGCIPYPFGWRDNNQLKIEVYSFTTATQSSLIALYRVDIDYKPVGGDLNTLSTNRATISTLNEISGSSGANNLVYDFTQTRDGLRTMIDNGRPYGFPFRIIRQTSTAADTVTIDSCIVGVRFSMVSTYG